MSYKRRGIRDGTGSFKSSYQHTKSKIGKRRQAGQKCPKRKKK